MAALLVAVLASCESAAPAIPAAPPSSNGTVAPSPTDLAVAYVADLSPEGALERTLPSLQAVRLAFATAALSDQQPLEVEVVLFDTEGEVAAGAEIAAEIVEDARYVAVIAAPELSGQAELAAALSPARVPLLSLSARGSVDPAGPGMWLRFVAPIDALARDLGEAIPALLHPRKGLCIAPSPTDGTTFVRTLRRSLPPDLPESTVEGPAAADEAGCGIVIWTGDGERAAEFAASLSASPGTPVLAGGPSLLDPSFLDAAAESAEGALSVCSCADVSTSLDLAAQRFIQDYQSEHGSPPGPYAVEGWDAARQLVRALRAAGSARSDLVEWLADHPVVEGVGGTYVFEEGELVDPGAAIRRYRVDGGRWLLVTP